MKKTKTIIYGIGKYGKQYIDFCILYGVTELELVDSNPHLCGKEYRGFKICSPNELIWENYRLVVIAVGDKDRQDIYNRLTEIYNVSKRRIAYYNETVILSEKDIYNWGNMIFDGKAREIVAVKEMIRQDSMNDLEKFFFKEKHLTMTKWMHYFEAYDRFFSRYRGKDITILEIGVFKGGSLQMWKNYFKNSNNKVKIYGIDINPDCKKLEEEDIQIFIGSQEDREFLQMVKSEIDTVDILIDDGGHTMNQQMVSFEELFDLVDDNGIYLCEDLHTSYMSKYGGELGGATFMEYTKGLIDSLHAQYSETDKLSRNKYSEKIKFITYCDSMVFIEKRSKITKSLELII